MTQSRYLYGIVSGNEAVELDRPGIGDPPTPVRSMPVQEIAVLVSDIEDQDILPVRRDLLAHQGVLEAAMDRWDVLPVSFGTVCQSESDLVQLIEAQYPVFTSELQRIAGLVEVGVKVFWSREVLVEELAQRYPSLARLLRPEPDSEKQVAPGREQLIEVGQRVEALVADWRERYADEVCRLLGVFAAEYKRNDPIGQKMLFNVSFLIKRDRVTGFEEALHQIDKRYTPRLDFRYVKPMPPYNFINLRLESPAVHGIST